MRKILLFSILCLVLLTSCVQVRTLDYTNNSTSFDKANQELYLKLLNDINIKYVYLTTITDFDEYLTHLNSLSEISYNYIKDFENLTEESIDIEIDLQKKIIKTLKNLSIDKKLFSSTKSYQAAEKFISNYMIKLVETRLDYFELTKNNLKNPSINNSSKMSLIDVATIPNLYSTGENLRNQYLNN
jgi:hypothetical protein